MSFCFDPTLHTHEPLTAACQVVVAGPVGPRRDAIERILEEDGYPDVAYLASGIETLSICRQGAVDLLLLDLELPDMRGLVVLERLVPAMRHGALQVIVLAGEDHMERYGALWLGARDVLAEPLDPIEIRLCVRNALANSERESELLARNAELAAVIAEHFDRSDRPVAGAHAWYA